MLKRLDHLVDRWSRRRLAGNPPTWPLRPVSSMLTLIAGLGVPSQAMAGRVLPAGDLETSFLYPQTDTNAAAPIGVGDVNGDSIEDYIMAAPTAEASAVTDAGIVYLLFGPLDDIGADTLLPTGSGVAISGIEAGGQLGAGRGATGGRDLNGDGIDDLVLAAPDTSTNYGKVYILYGRTTGWESVSLSVVDGLFTASGPSNLGQGGVVVPGDLDGDGYNDLLIAAAGASASGQSGLRVGYVYVFYGDGEWAARTLATADAIIKGDAPNDLFGTTVVGGADVNGDGRPDFVVGATGHDGSTAEAGTVYLFAGGSRLSGTVTASTAALAQLQGDAANDQLGGAITLGDVSGDGIADMLVSASGSDEGGNNAGQVYVVQGRSSGWPASNTLIGSFATASFVGETVEDRLGSSIGPQFDFNSDQSNDIVIGVSGSDEGSSDGGEIAIFLGPLSRWTLSSPLSDADLRVVGEAESDGLSLLTQRSRGFFGDRPGAFVLAAAPENDAGGDGAGKVYAIPVARYVDYDGDGVSPGEGDCNDLVASVYPEAAEACDGLDNDCDEVIDEGYDQIDVYQDHDGDGYGAGVPSVACAAGPGYSAEPGDCDDTSATVYPGAGEACDGLDNDCDGSLEDETSDGDGDGVSICDGDCDDADADSFPGATELCDGLDNDCDGDILGDEADDDGDGYALCDGGGGVDCDDQASDTSPGAAELCDGQDNDCDGALEASEADGDGDGAPACNDCDDKNPERAPGLPEACDGLDNNCDGAPTADEIDGDGDGYLGCSIDGAQLLDCDQSDTTVHPGAAEVCDGKDTDCDGDLPENEADADGDGFSICSSGGNPGDCDDFDPGRYPGNPELCDDIDQDCDDGTTGYEDADGDGAGVCEDCDDGQASIHPGAADGEDGNEDGIDNDCDGLVDEGLSTGDDDTETGDDDTGTGEDTPAGDDDGTTGDDDTDVGDDDTGSGDDDATAGDDDATAGDDDATAGDDDATAGDDDATAGDDDTSGDDDASGGDDDASTAGDDDASPPDETPTVVEQELGGCSCTQTGPGRTSPGALVLAAASLAGMRRRRSRR